MFRFIFALILIVGAGGIFFYYTKPAYDSTKQLQADIQAYNQALDKANELQRLRQALLSRYNTFNQKDIERLARLLPDHVDNVRLLLDLDSFAGSQGFALQNVSISSTAGRATTNQSAAGVIGATGDPYESLTFGFSTQGTYPAFVAFIEALERSLRIVDIVSLSVEPIDTPDGIALPQPYYTFDVALKTYWLK